MGSRKLTKPVVDALVATGKEYAVWCAKLPGFGVRVRPTGAMSYVAIYKTGGRNTPFRRVTIGSVNKLPLEKARAEAERILASAKLGADTAAEKAAKNAEKTVAEICDLYIKEGADLKKESTLVSDRSRIARHIKPLIGKKRIGDLTRADIERMMRDIANGKTAMDEKNDKPRSRSIVKGGKGTATRTVRQLGGILTWAVSQGYLERSPRAGVKLYKDGKGERFLSGDELQRLGDALRDAETTGLPWAENEGKEAKHRPKDKANAREVVSPYAVAAIRLLIFTGCRAGEVLNLRWSEVDFDHGVLNLPDSKTGAKKVLLAAPALKVLADLDRVGEYVIAGNDPNRPRSDIKRPWARITAYAGLGGLRLHDLRHSFASVGAASGMGLGVVGKLLGHASPATTARYSHLADDPVRRAGERIAAEIAAKMGDADIGKVVPLKGRG
jgi:integrase